jgi:hypothetical protein
LENSEPAELIITIEIAIEFFPAAIEVADEQPTDRFIQMRLGMVRPQRQRLLVTRQRFTEPLELIKGEATIPERLGMVRPQRQRVLVARQRFTEPLELIKGEATMPERLGMVWLHRQSSVIPRERIFKVPELTFNDRQ